MASYRKINPFREAKQHLWDGRGLRPNNLSQHICYAVNDMVRRVNFNGLYGYRPASQRQQRHTNHVSYRARVYINKMLGDHEIIEDYVEHVISIPYKKQSKLKVQQFRHHWLDHMAQLWDKGEIK